MDEKSLKEEIRELKELIGEKKEPRKGLWIPFMARVGNKAVQKDYVTVMKINDNRNISFERQKIDEGTIMVDGSPRIATADEVLYYKKKPIVILPSWSVKPFSPTDNYGETVKQNYASQGYKLLLNRMNNEIIKAKKTISGMAIFIVIVAVIGIGYLGYQQGWF